MAYTTSTNMPLKMPTPGTREPAQISLINDNMLTVDGHDHTSGKGVPVSKLRSGLAANRPAPSAAGQVYFSTDTGAFSVDNGTAWVDFLTAGGAFTVTGWTLVNPTVRNAISFGAQPSGALDTVLTRNAPGVLDLTSSAGSTKAWMTFRASGAVGSARFGQPTNLEGAPAQATVATWIASNADYDGTNWNRDATASPASIIQLGSNADTVGAGCFGLYSVRAGTGAITWQPRLSVTNVGTLSLTPDSGSPSLLANSPAGIGSNPPSNLNSGVAQLAMGSLGMLWSNGGLWGTADPAGTTAALVHNGQYVAGGIATIAAGRYTLLQVGQNGYLTVYGSASVAANTVTAALSRLQVGPPGSTTMTLYSDPNTAALYTMSFNTTVGAGIVPQIMLSRNTASTHTQFIHFQNSIGQDVLIGRRANSDDFVVAAFDGATLTNRLTVVPSTGSVFINPLGGQPDLSLANGTVQNNTAGSNLIMNAGFNNVGIAHANAVHYWFVNGAFYPAADNAFALGQPSTRWNVVYAATGTINTSVAEAKTDFSLLDPAACADAVLGTDWLSFTYLPPEMQEGGDPEEHAKRVAESAHHRKQNGYALGHPTHKTHDLFGLGDRQTKNNGSDLGIVACALQAALQRIAALEAKNA